MPIWSNNFTQFVLGTGLILMQSAAYSQTPNTQPDAQQIQQIVRQYILDHPEVVLDSIRQFQEKEQAAQKQRIGESIVAHRAELLNEPATPSVKAGNPTGEPVTVVEFFDYRCGYCRKVAESVAKLAGTPGVRIVYKEFPILGAESVLAAKAALAADRQGAFQKFHDRLMTTSGAITAELIDQMAAEWKLDLPRLHKDMDSPEVDAAINRNFALAGSLHVESTPTFVVGKQLVPGAINPEALQALIDAARGESKPAPAQAEGGNF